MSYAYLVLFNRNFTRQVLVKTIFSSYQVFAELYSLKFVPISESEKDDGSVVIADEEQDKDRNIQTVTELDGKI